MFWGAGRVLGSHRSDPRTKSHSAYRCCFCRQAVKRIIDVRLAENAPRGRSGQGRGHLVAHLQRHQCWLEFMVEQSG